MPAEIFPAAASWDGRAAGGNVSMSETYDSVLRRGTGVAASRGRMTALRVLLYFVLMAGLAARERLAGR